MCHWSLSLQVLLAMHANVEDRGIKGDITPLMAAANGGHVKIVKLLLAHGADVNAQSSTGKEGGGTTGELGFVVCRKLGVEVWEQWLSAQRGRMLPCGFATSVLFTKRNSASCWMQIKCYGDIQRWIRSVSNWKVFEYIGFVVTF